MEDDKDGKAADARPEAEASVLKPWIMPAGKQFIPMVTHHGELI